MQFPEFKDKVAVITGGSDGLGLDFVRGLVQAGAVVHFCGRDQAKGEAAAKPLGARGIFHAVDLAEPSAIEQFIRRVGEISGRVDYLINNAATDDRIEFKDVTADACDFMYRVNLRSCLLVSRACLDLLKKGAGKSIVNLGTTNYMLGLEPFTIYNATKSGILGLTRSMARELGRDGIRVNMLSPGWIMTAKQLKMHVREQDKKDLLRDQALKFLLHPEHVTPALLFLLSDAAVGITGQNIVVDGGKHMQ